MIMCDPRAKVRCPFKNSCCGDETAYFVEGSECDEFNQIILAPPPTNADRIRSMTDEQLARWLEYEGGGACAEMCGWLNWLQQPAEDIGDGT